MVLVQHLMLELQHGEGAEGIAVEWRGGGREEETWESGFGCVGWRRLRRRER